MNPKLEALLTLQQHDDELTQTEAKLAALKPKFAALDNERAAAERQRATTRGAIEREELRQRELSGRADDFRRLNARAIAAMDQVHKAREATAASAQIDISRRALADVEAELSGVNQRLSSLRDSDAEAEMNIAELEDRQAEARKQLEAERAKLEEEVAAARARRQEAARRVESGTLVRYDRVRSRRRQRSVFPLRGLSCSNCDTAIPTQRRATLLAGDTVDVCESCGVLLYAAT